MVFVEHFHWHKVIGPAPAESRIRSAPTEPREDLGKFADIIIRIGWDRVAVGIVFIRTVGIHLIKPNGKKLHIFPGEVFIRVDVVVRIGFAVVDMTKIETHRRMQGDGAQ